jgi:hypothetical protein
MQLHCLAMQPQARFVERFGVPLNRSAYRRTGSLFH